MTPTDIRSRTRTVLERTAEQLRDSTLPPTLARQMEQLAAQVDQPCVVAVVGRVKAGKSTFINALLGEDLAKVDAAEATATINVFSWGRPADPTRPVRCHWRGSPPTDEPASFLDRLQGHDKETLQLAEGIHYLEYVLENPWLRDITLVDTPGTGAVVEEHQARVDEFLQLRAHLNSRSGEETTRQRADAIIYLVGAAARASDRSFLENASGDASGLGLRSFNSLGVMAKTDISDGVLTSRFELCEHFARQMEGRLNTVLPVAATIARAVAILRADDHALLAELASTLRRIPLPVLEQLLETDVFYDRLDDAECPVSAAERSAARARLDAASGSPIPWRTFVQIARLAGDASLDEPAIIGRLEEISGFPALNEKLRERFTRRSHLLRCNGIVHRARDVLNELRFQHLPDTVEKHQANQARMGLLLSGIPRVGIAADVAAELEELVRARYDDAGQIAGLRVLYDELDENLSELSHELEAIGADFEALQLLDEHRDRFESDELVELEPLLGRNGLDLEHRLMGGRAEAGWVRERQISARHHAHVAPDEVRRNVYKQVELRYGALLWQLRQAATSAPAGH